MNYTFQIKSPTEFVPKKVYKVSAFRKASFISVIFCAILFILNPILRPKFFPYKTACNVIKKNSAEEDYNNALAKGIK